MLDDIMISRAIIEAYFQEILGSLESDVIICGAGPSGLCASYYLCKDGYKVVVLEKNLRPGGGMLLSGQKVARLIAERLKSKK